MRFHIYKSIAGILGRLSFAKKFLFLGAVCALTVGTLLFLYLDSEAQKLRQAFQYKTGLGIQRQTLDLLSGLSQWSLADYESSRGNAVLASQRERLTTQVDSALVSTLGELSKIAAIRSNPEDFLGRTRKAWAELRGAPQKMSAGELRT